jgi:hypothetical protein
MPKVRIERCVTWVEAAGPWWTERAHAKWRNERVLMKKQIYEFWMAINYLER